MRLYFGHVLAHSPEALSLAQPRLEGKRGGDVSHLGIVPMYHAVSPTNQEESTFQEQWPPDNGISAS